MLCINIVTTTITTTNTATNKLYIPKDMYSITRFNVVKHNGFGLNVEEEVEEYIEEKHTYIHVAAEWLVPAFQTVIHSDDGLGIDFNNMHVNLKFESNIPILKYIYI